jgi:hypothetical protein
MCAMATKRPVRRPPSLISRAASDFRNATASELKLMGVSLGSQRLIEKTVKRVGKNTASISRRTFLKLKGFEKTGERLSLEKLAARRRTGEIAYRSHAAAEQAAKQIETRRRVALIAAVLKSPPTFSPRAIEPPRPGRNRQASTYNISETPSDIRAALREKIIHERYVEDGTWQHVQDWLRARDQEELADLFRASGRSSPIL